MKNNEFYTDMNSGSSSKGGGAYCSTYISTVAQNADLFRVS